MAMSESMDNLKYENEIYKKIIKQLLFCMLINGNCFTDINNTEKKKILESLSAE